MKKSTRNLLLIGLAAGGYLYWKNQQAAAVPMGPAPIAPSPVTGAIATGVQGAAQAAGGVVSSVAGAISNLFGGGSPTPTSGYVSPTYMSRSVRNYANGLSGYVSPTYMTRAVRTYSLGPPS